MEKRILFLLVLSLWISSLKGQRDFSIDAYANFAKYKDANMALDTMTIDEPRVVFMGNSITESWESVQPEFFANKNYVNRGISGQVSHQMLLRFRADVLDLNPALVVILAGTNDIAENSGPVTLNAIAANIFSMAELAKGNNIKVILCSVLPAIDFPWRPGLSPAEKIIELNEKIQAYAKKNGLIYLDYYQALVDEAGGLKVPDYTTADDLVHPNKAAYEIMAKLAEAAIAEALQND